MLELTKATDSDSDALIQFFAQTETQGPARLQVHRQGSFFNQYKLQSDDWVTYLLRTQEGNIEASASFIFREAVVDGVRQTVGYATDLRVLPTRRAILTWSQHFLPVLEAERSKRNCKYIFTVVAEAQRQAYNAFIRPRGVKRVMPRYFLFRKFSLISLHGMWPFHPKPLPGIKVRHAETTDLEKLSQYMHTQATRRPLNYFPQPESFGQSLDRWQNLKLKDFLIAYDRFEKIIGCVAPWRTDSVQKAIVQSYDSPTKNLQDILTFFSLFRIAHPMPKEKSVLPICHLTHLQADNPDILYSLLYYAYRNSNRNDILLYPHFENELHTAPPRSFISGEIEYGFYCILSPTDPIPDFLRPSANYTPPMFEPAFL